MKIDKGSTSMLILSLLEKEDMYGYKITAQLKFYSDDTFNLKEGTLYPLLHSLENKRCIESYWVDADSGRKRKYYRITKNGIDLLDSKKKEWGVYTDAVNKVIGGARHE